MLCSRQRKVKSGNPKYQTKVKTKKKDEEVVINICLMEWSEKHAELKAKRGKKLPLRISTNSNYTMLKRQAVEKWRYFYDLYDENELYHLLYEDGTKALFLPGPKKEPFSLRRYQEEIGKDYKRITMFICTAYDYNISEGDFEADEELEDEKKEDQPKKKAPKRKRHDSEDDDILMNDDPLGKKDKAGESTEPNSSKEVGDGEAVAPSPVRIDLTSPPSSTPSSSVARQTELDAQLATQLQNMYDENSGADNNEHATPTAPDNSEEAPADPPGVIKAISKKVDKSKQLFIVIRRGCPLSRVLEIWRREIKKDPTNLNKLVRVHFNGEQGIDSGATAAEFFTQTLPLIGSVMFPNGSPLESTYHVQNEDFLTCGQIIACSPAQGGPSPGFLQPSVFNIMAESHIKLQELDPKKHLTKDDKALIESVTNDVKSHTDSIIDHGYTGCIDKDHITEISKSMAVSIVSRRLVYVKEVMEGLQLFGLADTITKYPEACRPLLVLDTENKDTVDANYVFSILFPNYSQKGSSRRQVEEAMMDFFQDFLFKLEDGSSISGYTEEIAWAGDDADEEPSISERVQGPDMTPPGLLGWLTGQKHKPLGSERLTIAVDFNHTCLTSNPHHRICFPVVSACTRVITLPVVHMKTAEEFNQVMLLAFSKGQSFGMA